MQLNIRNQKSENHYFKDVPQGGIEGGEHSDKLKCRIVAVGHQQSFGTSYSEVSVSTVNMTSVFILLSMNKYLQGDISSVNIPMAYLNAS